MRLGVAEGHFLPLLVKEVLQQAKILKTEQENKNSHDYIKKCFAK